MKFTLQAGWQEVMKGTSICASSLTAYSPPTDSWYKVSVTEIIITHEEDESFSKTSNNMVAKAKWLQTVMSSWLHPSVSPAVSLNSSSVFSGVFSACTLARARFIVWCLILVLHTSVDEASLCVCLFVALFIKVCQHLPCPSSSTSIVSILSIRSFELHLVISLENSSSLSEKSSARHTEGLEGNETLLWSSKQSASQRRSNQGWLLFMHSGKAVHHSWLSEGFKPPTKQKLCRATGPEETLPLSLCPATRAIPCTDINTDDSNSSRKVYLYIE